MLAAMIAIRTLIGWTMVLEMNGRWPWQRRAPTEAQSTPWGIWLTGGSMAGWS